MHHRKIGLISLLTHAFTSLGQTYIARFLDSVNVEMSYVLIMFPSLSSRSPDKYEEMFTANVSTFIMTSDIQNAA